MDPVTAVSKVFSTPELCHIIFSYLDPVSIKQATLVSRLWKEILEDKSGKFWKWARCHWSRSRLRSRTGRIEWTARECEELLHVQRLALVTEIMIDPKSEKGIVRALLKAVEKGLTTKLKRLDMQFSWAMLDIDPILISTAVLQVQECVIGDGELPQLQAILSAINNSTNIRLKSLELRLSSKVGKLSPACLAGAALKLETFKSRLSSAQLEAILAGIAGSEDPTLRNLVCFNNPRISHVDPEILAEAFVKLRTVEDDLGSVSLSNDQVSSLFSRIRESPNLRLTELSLMYQNLSMVPDEIFAEALSRLERVTLSSWSSWRVTPSQVNSLLTLVSHQDENEGGEFKLKDLRLPFTNISTVDPEVLVGALQRLEKVCISSRRMTQEQLFAIIHMVREEKYGKLHCISFEI